MRKNSMMNIVRKVLFHSYLIIKKLFDFTASATMSVLLLVPMMMIAVVIAGKDGGFPLYRQKRTGFRGSPIFVYKFRTMKKKSDQLEDALTEEQISEYYKEYKLKDDTRLIGYSGPESCLSCLGGRLRATCLDEIPQIFFNIFLLGNMSFVGPRPILEDELQRYYTLPEQKILLSVKPGLTGYWQAYAHESAGYNNHRRQDMELFYVKHCSLLFDLNILIKTVQTVLKKASQGAERAE